MRITNTFLPFLKENMNLISHKGKRMALEAIHLQTYPFNKLKSALLLFVLMSTFASAQVTVDIPCTGAANPNSGRIESTTTRSYGYLRHGVSRTFRGWARFNIQDYVPSNATITAAEVHFYVQTSNGSAGSNYLKFFTGDPGSMTATAVWNAIGQVSAHESSSADLNPAGSKTRGINATGVTFLNTNKTQAVNLGFSRGTGNYGFYIYGADGVGNGSTDVTRRPVLRVTYTVPCTPPTNLTYSANPATYCKGQVIATNNPSFSGSSATSYSISPALPAGLSFNTSNGSITGTPSNAQVATNYTVTVTNGCGSTSTSVSIAVVNPPTANAGSNVTVGRGVAASLSGSYTNATGVSWSSSVAGTFSPSNTVTNPTWIPNDPLWTGAATLTMTTTGSPCNVSSTMQVNVTVLGICPGQNTGKVTFNNGSGSSNTYEVSINDGATYTAYTPGTAINTSGATGSVKIRATSTTSGGCAQSTVYTIWNIRTDCCNQPTATTTAASSIGCTTASTGGNVTAAATDPCTISERGVVYATTANPTIANSKVPASGTTGAFTSSLSGLANGTTYYVRTYVTTSSGTVYGNQISFTTLAAPSNLTYTNNAPTYCTGTAITNNTSSFTGAPATSYSVSPALPAGLSLNTSNGTISGTPTTATATATYTVTVNNACGSTTKALSITVNQKPTALSYAVPTASYCTGVAITNNTATFTGTASTFGISPALPAGLSLNTSNGTISGTPTAAKAATAYTVTATNGCGSTTATVNITVVATPSITAVTPGSRCGTGTVALSATASSGTINWYAAASGGTSLHSGASYTTPSITSTTNYWVAATVGTCTSSPRTQVTATVNPIPSAPTIGTVTQPTCLVGTGSVQLNNLPASGSWTVTGTPSGSLSGSGTSGTLSGLTGGSYTFVVTNSYGCTSAASASVVVNAAIPVPTDPTPTATYNCSNGTVSLNGGSLGANESFRWYNAATGGTVVSTANPFSPSITTTTNYYVAKYNSVSLCESNNRIAIAANKKGLDAYTASRNTGVAYADIAGSGTAVTNWRNGTSDNNLSNNINIGFSFPYDGNNHTQFRISTNGFITFNTSSDATGNPLPSCGSGDAYSGDNYNTFTKAGSFGTLQTIAPFYDNLITNGYSLNSSVHYLVSGTAPNRVLTVQWRGLSRPVSSNCGSPCYYGNYNFQVKLYEANGNIEFQYGTMTNGSDENSNRYTSGMNSASLSGTLDVTKLFTQQTANTATFSSGVKNNLTTIPQTNTKILFTRNVPVAASAVPQCIAYNAPANGATGQCTNTVLSWNAVDGSPTGYDVYVSTNLTLVTNADASVRVSTNQNSSYFKPTLSASTTYYWKIVPRNGFGTAIASNMPVWSFTTSAGDVVNSITSSAGTTFCVGTTTTLTVNGVLSEGSSYNWTTPFLFLTCKEGIPYPLLAHIFDDAACQAASRTITYNTAGTYTYYVFTKGCNGTSACKSITITVNDVPQQPGNFTVSSASVCRGQNGVVYTVPAVSGASSYTWSYSGTGATINGTGNSVTIDFSASATSGTLSVKANGTCGSGTARTMSITISPNNTVGAASSSPTTCVNTAITAITHTTTGATGTGTATGLPAGVTASFSSNTITISGTPTASGVFNYNIPLTGGCGSVSATGTITVNPYNTIAAGVNRTTCINTPITNISLATTGATGATFSGLPAGVTGSWSANTVTISGTPTVSGTFNYTVTMTGGCTGGTNTATGTITVDPYNTIAAGVNRTTCINTAITSISLATMGATGATFSGLPAGVTGSWSANVATISGTPTASGTFNYTVTMTGGCTGGTNTATGTITVNPYNTIAAGENRTTCINTPITSISLATTGATGATFSGLPTGVTGSWLANTVTISGTPTVSGTFNYTVTMTGGCTGGTNTATGTITVNANPAAPTAGTHTPGQNQIVWNWSAVSGVSGYKYNTTNNYATAIDNGVSTTFTQAGLTCGNTYTLYVWSYSGSCYSAPLQLTASTTSCCVAATIDTQPTAPAATCEGTGSQTISVSATGSGLTFVWRKNGVPVSNNSVVSGQGTATLVLTAPLATDGGSYDVVVSASCGAGVTSSSVAVTINSAPAITILPEGSDSVGCNNDVFVLNTSTTGGGSGTITYQWAIFDYGTSTYSNISGAVNDSLHTAPLTNPDNTLDKLYKFKVTYNRSGSGCAAASDEVELTILPTPSLTSTMEDCAGTVGGGEWDYIYTSASGGMPTYTVNDISGGSAVVYTSGGEVLKIYRTPMGAGIHTFEVTDANGCKATSTLGKNTGLPTTLPNVLTPGNAQSQCILKGFNEWVHFRKQGSASEVIASVKDNGVDLGMVTVESYREAVAPQVPNLGTSCSGTLLAAMRRHFVVKSGSYPDPSTKFHDGNANPTDVSLRLYFSQADFDDLVATAAANNVNGNHCTEDDDITSMNALYLTKYSGSNEDGDYMNNDFTSGYFKVFNVGNLTNPLAIQQNGFDSIFGTNGTTFHYAELNVSEFSELWLHGSNNGTPLPVEMLFIEAKNMNNEYIKINWATATELNNMRFDVERSTDGVNFTKIGEVQGNGTSTERHDYSYNDKDVTAGIRYYYRLKQIDFDEKYEYSPVVSEMLRGEDLFRVSEFVPNPAADQAKLFITTGKEQEISIEMHNYLGEVVKQGATYLNKGSNTINFDFGDLAAGTYTTRVVAGANTYVRRVIITR